MSVCVVTPDGKPLMPTSEYRARKLLKSGKAVIFRHKPFTIKLTRVVGENVQPIEYCCDTGYKHIGVSVKSKKHEYFDCQFDMLQDEKNVMMTVGRCAVQEETGFATESQGSATEQPRKRKDGWHRR